MPKVKAYELQSKCVIGKRKEKLLELITICRSKNDLAKQLQELKNELLNLRVQKIVGSSASKLTKM